jgi:oligopeptide transport system ATP-binding protein
MRSFLEVSNLSKAFKKNRAIDRVSFSVEEGSTLGIVGESGCGKSTLGRTIVRLYQADAGKIYFKGQELTQLTEQQFRPLRRYLQMIFQDPYLSLDPRMTAGEIIAESLYIHKLFHKKSDIIHRQKELMAMIGMNSEHLNRYPHEFSGGQRQRIGLARALAVGAQLIICDEPVSALDVSIQAQIINLFQDIQEKLKLTYLFISHDLAMVRHLSHQVAVMYLGQIVELASRDELFTQSLHPYTHVLISAVPEPDPDMEKNRYTQSGPPEIELGDINYVPCRFFDRCKEKKAICGEMAPSLKEVTPGHWVACHHFV